MLFIIIIIIVTVIITIIIGPLKYTCPTLVFLPFRRAENGFLRSRIPVV